jgi:hypothetical protein
MKTTLAWAALVAFLAVGSLPAQSQDKPEPEFCMFWNHITDGERAAYLAGFVAGTDNGRIMPPKAAAEAAKGITKACR